MIQQTQLTIHLVLIEVRSPFQRTKTDQDALGVSGFVIKSKRASAGANVGSPTPLK